MEINGKQLAELIALFKEFDMPRMIAGEAYYKNRNIAIMEREKTFYSITARKDVADCTKANHKLASGFTRLLVDQKLYYSINKKMTLTGLEDTDILDEKKFKKELKRVGREATNKIYSVLHWFVQDGELKYKLIPSEQMILVYNKDDNSILEAGVRIYKEGTTEKADVIDAEGTQTWTLNSGEWKSAEEKQPHMSRKVTSGEVVVSEEPVAWSQVPLSVMYNNDTHQTDLEMFKPYVDMYDVTISDFGNNLDDFQELYWVLKGYNGQDAKEFVEEFKKSRIIKVGADGDASQKAQEVPHEARQAMLSILAKDIYRFAMGVDPDSISGDTTNITIKALFANLDLKANGFEEQIEEFLAGSLVIINDYARLTSKTAIEEIEAEFERSTIINKKEVIELLIQQRNFRADEELLKEHPDVEDIEAELLAIKTQRDRELDELGGSLGFKTEPPADED